MKKGLIATTLAGTVLATGVLTGQAHAAEQLNVNNAKDIANKATINDQEMLARSRSSKAHYHANDNGFMTTLKAKLKRDLKRNPQLYNEVLRVARPHFGKLMSIFGKDYLSSGGNAEIAMHKMSNTIDKDPRARPALKQIAQSIISIPNFYKKIVMADGDAMMIKWWVESEGIEKDQGVCSPTLFVT